MPKAASKTIQPLPVSTPVSPAPDLQPSSSETPDATPATPKSTRSKVRAGTAIALIGIAASAYIYDCVQDQNEARAQAEENSPVFQLLTHIDQASFGQVGPDPDAWLQIDAAGFELYAWKTNGFYNFIYEDCGKYMDAVTIGPDQNIIIGSFENHACVSISCDNSHRCTTVATECPEGAIPNFLVSCRPAGSIPTSYL
jgi:hypothetical protein